MNHSVNVDTTFCRDGVGFCCLSRHTNIPNLSVHTFKDRRPWVLVWHGIGTVQMFQDVGTYEDRCCAVVANIWNHQKHGLNFLVDIRQLNLGDNIAYVLEQLTPNSFNLYEMVRGIYGQLQLLWISYSAHHGACIQQNLTRLPLQLNQNFTGRTN